MGGGSDWCAPTPTLPAQDGAPGVDWAFDAGGGRSRSDSGALVTPVKKGVGSGDPEPRSGGFGWVIFRREGSRVRDRQLPRPKGLPCGSRPETSRPPVFPSRPPPALSVPVIWGKVSRV